MSLVLVTGAAGFLGREVVRTLRAAGHGVRAMVQRAHDAAGIEPGAEPVVADLLAPPSLEAAVRGVSVVCHCAAKLPGKGNEEAIWQVNVEGTRHLTRSAVAAGVRRLVYVSTDSVYGDGNQPAADEEAPIDPGYLYEGNYPRAKLEGERIVQAAAAAHGIEAVILRTCFMYGPGRSAGSDLLRRLAQKRIHPLIDHGASLISVAYVTDVAEAVRLCVESPRAAGKAFNVVSGTHPKREIVARVARAAGRRPLLLPLPARPLAPVAAVLHAVLRPIAPGLAARVDPRRIDFARAHHAMDIGRIRRELGYEPRVTLDEGIGRTFATEPGP